MVNDEVIEHSFDFIVYQGISVDGCQNLERWYNFISEQTLVKNTLQRFPLDIEVYCVCTCLVPFDTFVDVTLGLQRIVVFGIRIFT